MSALERTDSIVGPNVAQYLQASAANPGVRGGSLLWARGLVHVDGDFRDRAVAVRGSRCMPTGWTQSFADHGLKANSRPWRPTFSAERSMKRHGWAIPGSEPKADAPISGAGAGGTHAPGVAVRTATARVTDGGGRACETSQSTRRTRRRHDSATPAGTPKPTMFFLDWDDTLLPTTHLRSAKCFTSSGGLISDPPPSLRVQLLALEREVCDLLSRVQEQPGAVVCIVTNASEGWVQSSAAQFMPAVAAAIESRQIRVRHARTASAARGVADQGNGTNVLNPARWKADVFWEELAPLRWQPTTARSLPPPRQGDRAPHDENLTNTTQYEDCELQPVRIVSIGDSQWERTAASVVGCKGDIIVTVKLAANPSCAALRQQLRRIRQAVAQLSTAKHSASINAVAQRETKVKVAPTPLAVAKESNATPIIT